MIEDPTAPKTKTDKEPLVQSTCLSVCVCVVTQWGQACWLGRGSSRNAACHTELTDRQDGQPPWREAAGEP